MKTMQDFKDLVEQKKAAIQAQREEESRRRDARNIELMEIAKELFPSVLESLAERCLNDAPSNEYSTSIIYPDIHHSDRGHLVDAFKKLVTEHELDIYLAHAVVNEAAEDGRRLGIRFELMLKRPK